MAAGSKPARKRGPGRSPLVIEEIEDHRNPSFEDALRLYNRVFPDDERIDRRYFRQLLEEKRRDLLFPFNFHFLVARVGERVAGMATGNYLAVVNKGFVGYLAVEPRWAGRRVGTRLRHRLVEEMRRDARAARHDDLEAVLGEVEADNRWLRHLIKTRNAFALDIDYRQPPLREGGKEVPLVLYVEPIARPIRRMAASEVRSLVYAVYRRMYRIRFPLREPSFRRMLASLEGRRWVGSRRRGGKKPAGAGSGRRAAAGLKRASERVEPVDLS